MNLYKRTMKNKQTGEVYSYFVVDVGKNESSTRVRKNFRTFEAAQSWMRDFKKKKLRYGQEAEALSTSQQTIAISAFKKLHDADIANDVELLTAVDLFVSNREKVKESISLETALERYIESFSKEQTLQRKLVRTFISKVVDFFGADTKTDAVTEDDIQTFLDDFEKKGYAVKTYNGLLTYCKTFFNWCVLFKHIARNPVVAQVKRVTYKDPEFIPVDDLRGALATLEASKNLSEKERYQLINFFTLSFFCGIRSSEIFRLPPDAVHPEDNHPFVRISTTKGATKGIKGRTADLEANAVAWLKRYPFKQKILQTDIYKLRQKAFSDSLASLANAFVKNVGRHSYITYHTAKYRDCARTEAYVGTSASMRVKHYQGLATTAQGEDYFSIFPAL